MLCSIIIVNYNYSLYLQQAINSALAQSYANCEVIVVDDGSTDDSSDVIKSFGNRIISVFKENGGARSATNAGFIRSQGDLIFFLDADDWLDPEVVENVVNVYHEGVSYICWKLRKVSESGDGIGDFPEQGEGPDEGKDGWRRILDRGEVNYPPTSANAYHRTALNEIFPLPENESVLWPDVHMFYASPFLGEVVYLRRVLSNYRVHGKNNWYRSSGKKKLIRRPGFLWNKVDMYQSSIVRAQQKFDIMERGRRLKQADWGELALRRLMTLRWKRMISSKCLPDTHPFPEDKLKLLSTQIIELGKRLELSSFCLLDLRIRLLLTSLLPRALLGLFLFRKS